MAKKKETKSTKAKEAAATKPARRPLHAQAPVAATKAAQTATAEGATPAAAPRERVRDPRLPPPGTMIQKRARDGSVRCEVTVEADGIRYKGTLYRSLSAAALAAAKDLGIRGRAQNGYTFFGLSKPPRRAADPLGALGRAWDRYRERAVAAVGGAKDDERERVRNVLGEHADTLKELRGRVA